MKVTRALIEKYHEGLCDEEEKQVMEDWLLGNEEEEPPLFPLHIDKYKTEYRIWRAMGEKASDAYRRATRTRYLACITSCILILSIAGYFIYKGGNQYFYFGAGQPVQPGEEVAGDTLETGRGKKAALLYQTVPG